MNQERTQEEKIFVRFCEECHRHEVYPLKSESAKQKALILAERNAELKELYPTDLADHYMDAYRAGKAVLKREGDEQNRKWQEERRQEERKRDEADYELEEKLAGMTGRTKRRYLFQQLLAEARQSAKEADEGFNNALRGWDAAKKTANRDDSSWGTLGGIAAGITGSTAVGAAVAAGTMNRNAQRRADNAGYYSGLERSSYRMAEIMDNLRREEKKEVERLEKLGQGLDLQLVREDPDGRFMELLELSQPEKQLTEGGTLVIRVQARAKKGLKIEELRAVMEGSLEAAVYRGNQYVGSAHLNLPSDGLDTNKVSLEGRCLEAGKGKYSVLLLPEKLWLIERLDRGVCLPELKDKYQYKTEDDKWTPISLNETASVEQLKREKAYVKGDKLQKDEQYSTAAEAFRSTGGLRDADERAQECERLHREREAEIQKRAEEAERREAVRRARNKKIAVVVIPLAAVALAGAMIWNNVIVPGRDYKAAVELMGAGKYEEAIDAFEALGNRKDSPEQILECRYRMARELQEDGEWAEAQLAFEELGDYSDSPEMVKACQDTIAAGELEEKYQEALKLLKGDQIEQGEAYQSLTELGDYKDAPSYLEKFRYMVYKGGAFHYHYDSYGRLIKREPSDDRQHTIEYIWDGNGKLVGAEAYKVGVNDEHYRGRHYTYAYNEAGQCVGVRGTMDGYDEILSVALDYDGQGRCIRRTYDTGEENSVPAVWTYEYEGDRRVRETVSWSGKDKIERESEYIYDSRGHCTENKILEDGKEYRVEYHYTPLYAPDCDGEPVFPPTDPMLML